MNSREQKAQEWLKQQKGEVTNKKIQQWAGSDRDLQTITSILSDPESLIDFQNNPRKEDLTNYNLPDAIEEYISFPKWFKVFVPVTPVTLNILSRNYPEQHEFAKALLEEFKISVAEDYLNELHFNGVVTFPLNFSASFNLGEIPDFDSLIEALMNEIKVTKNLVIEELSSKVFTFFLGDMPREKSSKLHYKYFTKSLEEAYKQYKETQEILDQDVDTVADFIKKIIKPPFIKVQGNFANGEDVLDYYLDNPFSQAEISGQINAKNHHELKKEAQGEMLEYGWDSAKLISKAISTSTGTDFLDPLATIDDVRKWVKQTMALFEDDEQIQVLFKEFEQQEIHVHFKEFIKHKVKSALAKVAFDLFKIEAFDVEPEFLESFYQQFHYFNVIDKLPKKPGKLIDVAKELKKQQVRKSSGDAQVDKVIQNYARPSVLTRLEKKIRI